MRSVGQKDHSSSNVEDRLERGDTRHLAAVTKQSGPRLGIWDETETGQVNLGSRSNGTSI